MMLHYHDLAGVSDPYTGVFLDRIQQSFPPNEQMSMSSILGSISERSEGQILQVVLSASPPDGIPVGMIWEERSQEPPYTLLWYLAAVEKGGGIGTRIYQDLRERTRASGLRAILFEVERPDCTPDPETAIRRIAWYRRNGARLCRNIEYHQTVGWQPPVPMYLMVDTLDSEMPDKEVLSMLEDAFGNDVTPASHIDWE